MAVLDFLGGGLLTYLVILLILLPFLWILAKIFGFGRKNLGGYANAILRNKLGRRTQEEEKRGEEETMLWGRRNQAEGGEEKVIEGIANFLREIQSSGDFNDTKVQQLRQYLNAERELINQGMGLANKLKEDLRKDQKESKEVLKEAKKIIGYLQRMKALAGKRLSFIASSHAPEGASLAASLREIINVVGIVENIDKSLEAYEAKEMEDAKRMEAFLETGIQESKKSLDLVDRAMGLLKDPSLQKVPQIEQHVMEMRARMKQLHPVGQELGRMAQERGVLLSNLLSEEEKLTQKAEEMQTLVQTCTAQINMLVQRNVLSKKAAA